MIKISPSMPSATGSGPDDVRHLRALVRAGNAKNLAAAAVRIASAGLPVLPLAPGSKVPLTRHGHLDATTDLFRIRRWWAQSPEANIGLVTGTGSFDVLDVDVRPGGSGIELVNDLITRGVLPEPGLRVRTPSGGLHLYYRGTEQRSSRLPRRFIDLKASGGYVVVPPSTVDTSDGTRARYVVERAGAAVEELPWRKLRPASTPPRRPEGPRAPGTHHVGRSHTIARLEGYVLASRAGERNDRLFWALCRAVEGGLDVGALRRAGRHVGLSEIEVAKAVRSAHRRVTGR